MEALGLADNQFIVPVLHAVTIGDAVYANASFVCRLLTINELMHIDRYTGVINDIMHEGKEFDFEDDWFFIERDAIGEVKLVVEEEVFARCCIGVLGANVLIDIENIEAGVVSKIGQAILRRSLDLYINYDRYTEEFTNLKSRYFDIIKSLLCRYQNAKMEELDVMPIDQLLRRFAMLRAAFPKETEITSQESDNDG